MLELKVDLANRELLIEYGAVPIEFYVETEYKVIPVENGLGGLVLEEVKPELPYWVDHDAGEAPEEWWNTWDMSRWGVISAFIKGQRIGGGIVAYDTPGIELLRERSDLGLLWDLRVAEAYRQQGLKQLKIETQTYNIAACKFYAKQGAVLGTIDCYAYPQLPRIKQLIWYYDL